MNSSLNPHTSHLDREWLETDGLGGFVSGTVSGIRTRRYHALLLTAATPPTGRVVLVNGFEAWIETPRGKFALTSQRYARTEKLSALPMPEFAPVTSAF